MVIDYTELERACHKLAEHWLWKQEPFDAKDIDELAQRFLIDARRYAEYLASQDRDPSVMVHMLRYLMQHHSEPRIEPERDFFCMLHVLTELVCPNAETSEDSERFYRDVERGIELTREE